VENVIKNMRWMAKEEINLYLNQHESERGISQLIDYSEFQIGNFWRKGSKLEEDPFVDSIFFRTVEWCKIGIFDDWV
jgi:hypothetical protein